MKILVCGSRDFTDTDIINRLLDAYAPTCVVNGAAKGADAIASYWARANLVQIIQMPAMWKMNGKAAGPIRNQEMLEIEKPEIVLAFVNKPLAQSVGTADMVRRARAAGIRTYVVEATP